MIGPCLEDESKSINLGKAAHICAASPGGPRYDVKQTPEQRKSIGNGIYLCGVCADDIDKNDGIDFPASTLHEWKRIHENSIREKVNKGELDDRNFKFVVWNSDSSGVAAIAQNQTVIVNNGISEKRVREICTELFQNNFVRMSE